MSKICTKCKVDKPLENFNRSGGSKDGHTYWCRSCAKEYNDSRPPKYYEVSVEEKTRSTCGEVKASCDFYKHRGRSDGLSSSCRECVLARWKSLSFPISVEEKQCSVCGQIKGADCFNKDKTKTTGLESHCRECQSKYNAATREIRNKKNTHRLNTDVDYRLSHLLRGRLRIAIARNYKAGSAVRDLGCSIPEFRLHLESLFQPGMTWGNYGSGSNCWHIDHIVPLANFDLTNRQHLLLACNYMNLQPLWETDNISKGCRYEAPTL